MKLSTYYIPVPRWGLYIYFNAPHSRKSAKLSIPHKKGPHASETLKPM